MAGAFTDRGIGPHASVFLGALMSEKILHPRHPGIGSSTALIAAEGDSPEDGGLFIFFPSGATKGILWHSASPIRPAIDAAKKYTAQVLEELLKANTPEALRDIQATNWVSVIAAIHKIINDFNGNLHLAINTRIAKDLQLPPH
jgi:hypothetical protein